MVIKFTAIPSVFQVHIACKHSFRFYSILGARFKDADVAVCFFKETIYWINWYHSLRIDHRIGVEKSMKQHSDCFVCTTLWLNCLLSNVKMIVCSMRCIVQYDVFSNLIWCIHNAQKLWSFASICAVSCHMVTVDCDRNQIYNIYLGEENVFNPHNLGNVCSNCECYKLLGRHKCLY